MLQMIMQGQYLHCINTTAEVESWDKGTKRGLLLRVKLGSTLENYWSVSLSLLLAFDQFTILLIEVGPAVGSSP